MGTRTSKLLRTALVTGGLVLCLVVVLAAAGLVWLRRQPQGPDVMVNAPRFGDVVGIDDLVEIQAVARDSQGVVRLELWADGELIAVRTSQLPEGSTPFPLAEGWYARTAGTHTLVVRAYNRAQQSGQAAVLVEARELSRAEPDTAYQVMEGDTLESIADRHGLATEDLAGSNPGVSDPLPAGTSLTLPPPPPDDEGPFPTEAAPSDLLPGEVPPDPSWGREPGLMARLIPARWVAMPSDLRLELEVLSLEVGDDYDGIYCYYSLGGEPVERVPAAGYLEPAGERRWGIEDWLSGERRRLLILPEGSESLEIRGQCLGYRYSTSGGEIFDLGSLAFSSPRPEWDGTVRELAASGRDGWFRLSYRITSWTGLGGPPPRPSVAEEWPEGGVPTPVLVKECTRRYISALPVEAGGPAVTVEVSRWLITCALFVDPASVDGFAVDGFLFLRNGSLYQQIAHPRFDPVGITLATVVPALPADTFGGMIGEMLGVTGLPSLGETWEFQVVAYLGDPFADPPAGYRSPRSNVVTIGSEVLPEGMTVRVTFYELDMGCLHSDDYHALESWGLGPGEVDEEGHPIIVGCEDDLEEWGPGVYGGVDVNGTRVFSLSHYLHSGGRYPFERYIFFGYPSHEMYLYPGDMLEISMRLWDYDVWSDDEAICHDDVVYRPDELEAILGSGGARLVLGQEFTSYWGACYLHYRIDVWR
ncbi:MAG: LysM peptidoglycan-binding domain-containing protein [Chloroflexota bacterium]